MTDLRSPEDTFPEDAEVGRTQLYAGLKAAEDRYRPSLQQEDALSQPSAARSISLRLRHSVEKPQMARTRSAVRGPVTDGRGLGSLTPYVLPGILRRASMSTNFESPTLQVFSSQSLSDDRRSSEDSPREKPRARTAPRQRSQGIKSCSNL